MGAHLDIDDVVNGHTVAERQLQELRGSTERLKDVLGNITARFERCLKHAGNDPDTIAAATARAHKLLSEL